MIIDAEVEESDDEITDPTEFEIPDAMIDKMMRGEPIEEQETWKLSEAPMFAIYTYPSRIVDDGANRVLPVKAIKSLYDAVSLSPERAWQLCWFNPRYKGYTVRMKPELAREVFGLDFNINVEHEGYPPFSVPEELTRAVLYSRYTMAVTREQRRAASGFVDTIGATINKIVSKTTPALTNAGKTFTTSFKNARHRRNEVFNLGSSKRKEEQDYVNSVWAGIKNRPVSFMHSPVITYPANDIPSSFLASNPKTVYSETILLPAKGNFEFGMDVRSGLTARGELKGVNLDYSYCITVRRTPRTNLS